MKYKIKRGFISMLLGTLRASLLENILADKGAIAKNHGQGINRASEGIVRAGYGENKKTVKLIFNTANSLTNFEIQEYYQNKPRFNGVYSRDNLKKYRMGHINLDEYSDIGTFDRLVVERILKEIKTFISNKTNIFRIQANVSIMHGYFYIGFINFMLPGKTLTDFTNLFSPYFFIIR